VITIRPYRETDADCVGVLIADTYGEFNLAFATPEERGKLLGPFRYARSSDPAHRQAIAQVIWSDMVFVAEDDGQIVGVLRGREERLGSLFVRGDHHRRGIGRMLVECFEEECLRQGSTEVKVFSTLYAVPFYTEMGYKKTTGVRAGRSFEGSGLKWQPMKKRLKGHE
jgi:GNAT superfamily N-acetyltransferase